MKAKYQGVSSTFVSNFYVMLCYNSVMSVCLICLDFILMEHFKINYELENNMQSKIMVRIKTSSHVLVFEWILEGNSILTHSDDRQPNWYRVPHSNEVFYFQIAHSRTRIFFSFD